MIDAAALLLALVLAGCAAPPSEVRQWGRMREVMREGRTEPRVALAEVEKRPGMFAIGALAGLQGEILVLEGHVLVAIGDTRAQVWGLDETGVESATLLTATQVAAWAEEPWPNGGDLPALEQELARRLGRSLEEPGDPVVFQLEGEVVALELHVVRGFCPHGSAAPEREPARFAAASGAQARLIGFFAPQRAGELTHHGTALHVHALVWDETGAGHLGHVDAAILRPGSRLLLPAR